MMVRVWVFGGLLELLVLDVSVRLRLGGRVWNLRLRSWFYGLVLCFSTISV